MIYLRFILKLFLIFSVSFASNDTVVDSPRALASSIPNINFFDANQQPKCKLVLQHSVQANIIQNLLKIDKLNLIQFNLYFVNYATSPLKGKNSLNPHKWVRTASGQGLILLSLPFNHDLLSLKTLSLGTTKLGIDLIDEPKDCMKNATEEEQLYSIQYVLIRDFHKELVEFKWKEGVCQKVLKIHDKMAKFVQDCIVIGEEGLERREISEDNNVWLKILSISLMVIRVIALAYIPCLVIGAFKGIIKRKIPYIVKLKDDTFIRMRVIITDKEKIKRQYIEAKKEVLDLDNCKGFKHLRIFLKNNQYPLNEVFKVRFKRYDILVDYHRTQTENHVKVGLIHTFMDLIFRCKIKHLGPFVQCCKADVNKYICDSFCKLPWITCFRKFSAVFLVLVLPLPYYIRLIVYYCTGEQEQIDAMKKLTYRYDLTDAFSNSFILYLTPTHSVFIAFYVIYFITGCTLSLAPRKNNRCDRHQVLRRLVNSFRDLDEFSIVRVIKYVSSIVIWPFSKFGILGFLVAPFYWVLALPFMFFVCIIYSIPTFYLINRMIYYCRKAVAGRVKDEPTEPQKYQVRHSMAQKKLLNKLKIEFIIDKYKKDLISKFHNTERETPEHKTSNPVFGELADHVTDSTEVRKAASILDLDDDDDDDEVDLEVQGKTEASCSDVVLYVLTTILCILTTIGVVFLGADLIVLVVELIVFTIMGIIVNAGYVLRHVLVAAIVILYCVDNFFILEKRYLKMNKMIFAEVNKRVQELDKVTSLPSFLQENVGFKASDTTVNFYENHDTIIPVRHWLLNDLILFMDSEDTPRIPLSLFKKICSIKVPGVPGPVYRGQLDALKQLAKVLFMVFLVVIAVMVFGEVYSISSTNQLIATVAGSFIPLLFRSFIFKQKDEVEVNSLTFRCHLDELIKCFYQNWPVYDMHFEVDSQKDEKEVAMNEKACPGGKDDADQKADFLIVLPKGFKKEICWKFVLIMYFVFHAFRMSSCFKFFIHELCILIWIIIIMLTGFTHSQIF